LITMLGYLQAGISTKRLEKGCSWRIFSRKSGIFHQRAKAIRGDCWPKKGRGSSFLTRPLYSGLHWGRQKEASFVGSQVLGGKITSFGPLGRKRAWTRTRDFFGNTNSSQGGQFLKGNPLTGAGRLSKKRGPSLGFQNWDFNFNRRPGQNPPGAFLGPDLTFCPIGDVPFPHFGRNPLWGFADWTKRTPFFQSAEAGKNIGI